MTILNLIAKTLFMLSLCISITCSAIAGSKEELQESQQKFVELLPKDFKPAFTRETVIKLNAIVRRSYNVINEYDAVIEKTYSSVMQISKSEADQQKITETKQQVSVIQNLEQRSSVALSDMMSAVGVLKRSGEEHNKAILAGMIDFVKDVNQEISKKNAKMNSLLKDI
jgi:hypothetical protein